MPRVPCGSTSCKVRCAPIISRLSRRGRARKRSTRTPRPAPTREYRDGIDLITGSPLDERVYKAVE